MGPLSCTITGHRSWFVARTHLVIDGRCPPPLLDFIDVAAGQITLYGAQTTYLPVPGTVPGTYCTVVSGSG